MHRIDTSTRAVDLHGPGKDGFEDQDAPHGVPGTHVSADWLNDLQENVCEAIAGDGTTLVKGDGLQLLRAIRRMLSDDAALEIRALGVDSHPNQQINDALELDGVLYGVGQDGVVATSVDGIEWVDSIAGAETAHYVRMVEHPSALGLIGMVSSTGVYFVVAHPTSMPAPFLRTSGNYTGICAAADVVLAVSESAEAIYRIPAGSSGPGVGSGQYVAPPANARGGGLRPAKAIAYDAGVAVAVGPGGYVIRSTDEGETWTAIDPGADIDFDDVRASGGIFLARAATDVYRSTDLGLTWTLISGLVAPAIAEAPGGRFHAGHVFSHDGGATWTPVDESRRLVTPAAVVYSVTSPSCIAFVGGRWLALSVIIGATEIGQQLASGTRRTLGGRE